MASNSNMRKVWRRKGGRHNQHTRPLIDTAEPQVQLKQWYSLTDRKARRIAARKPKLPTIGEIVGWEGFAR